MNSKRSIKCALLVSLSFALSSAKAQLNPMAAQFYLNQYLGNPAYAGIDSGLNINLGYRSQWQSVPGAPKNQSLTGEYRFTPKAAVGVNLYSDKAGLINRTRAVGSYAYHMPLNDKSQELHFGVSLGVLAERIGQDEIKGSPGDASVAALNQREAYVDGDFGAAYTTSRITIQGAVPNLKSLLKKDDRRAADLATFFSAVSYRMGFGQGESRINLEPKFSYRGINGDSNMWDIGTSIHAVNNKVIAFAMYHNTNNMTYGFGAKLNSFTFQGIYSSEPAALRGNLGDSFELCLKVRAF